MTSDEVRAVLGAPSSRFRTEHLSDELVSNQNPARDEEGVLERYDGRGIACIFSRDRLSTINVFRSVEDAGWLQYEGEIVNGVKITDTKQATLDKLGKPTKTETPTLDAGTDPNVPVVWSAESKYHWRYKDYTLKATFLDQARSLNEAKHLTVPKDTIVYLSITK